MTDPAEPGPPDPNHDADAGDDEVVSAVLDGEATDAEVRRVMADPRLQARLAHFEHVASAVSAPVEPTGGARDAAVAAALAIEPEPRTSDLVARRERRRALAPWLAAAAALLVLIPLGLAVFRSGGTDEGTDTAARAPESAGTEASSDAEAGQAPTLAEGDAPTSTVAPAPEAGRSDADPGAPALALAGDLGPLDSPEALVDAARAVATAQAAADATTYRDAGGADVCEATLRQRDPSLGPTVARATATYRGAPAFVYVIASAGTDPPAPAEVIATAQLDCAELARQRL